MSPQLTCRLRRCSYFPRVSGDEPVMAMLYPNEVAFSPRERG